MANKKIVYAEPASYIPEYLRKELKLGKYAEKNTDTKKTVTKKETKDTKKTK